MNASVQFREPVEAKFTEWHNPLDREQYIDIKHQFGQPATRYRWKAGETKTMPSMYDHMIQKVHNGQIIGGKAPLLQKVGGSDVLDPALDMFAAAKKQAQAEQMSAAYAKKVADDTMLVAAAKVEETKAVEAKTKPERR